MGSSDATFVCILPSHAPRSFGRRAPAASSRLEIGHGPADFLPVEAQRPYSTALPASDAHSFDLPTISSFAPMAMASALTTSLPRRSPPSTITVFSCPKASTMGGQCIDQRHGAVEMASTMIVDNHSVRPMIDDKRNILGSQNTLNDQSSGPHSVAAGPLPLAGTLVTKRVRLPTGIGTALQHP